MAALFSARGRPRLALCSRAMASSANERIGATDQSQMMAQVLGGLGQVHGRELVARGDALVEGGEHAQP